MYATVGRTHHYREDEKTNCSHSHEWLHGASDGKSGRAVHHDDLMRNQNACMTLAASGVH